MQRKGQGWWKRQRQRQRQSFFPGFRARQTRIRPGPMSARTYFYLYTYPTSQRSLSNAKTSPASPASPSPPILPNHRKSAPLRAHPSTLPSTHWPPSRLWSLPQSRRPSSPSSPSFPSLLRPHSLPSLPSRFSSPLPVSLPPSTPLHLSVSLDRNPPSPLVVSPSLQSDSRRWYSTSTSQFDDCGLCEEGRERRRKGTARIAADLSTTGIY